MLNFKHFCQILLKYTKKEFVYIFDNMPIYYNLKHCLVSIFKTLKEAYLVIKLIKQIYKIWNLYFFDLEKTVW